MSSQNYKKFLDQHHITYLNLYVIMHAILLHNVYYLIILLLFIFLKD